MVRTSWSRDPWALGAYSYLPVGATPEARVALAEPVDDVLFFAGEALDGADPATVHGAQASGVAAAAAIERAATGPERIVVVGAGMAGAAAAARLRDAGHDVVVVEARDRTGGRVHTSRLDGWPLPVELGANWIHDAEGRASGLTAAADALGIATVPFDYDGEILGADGRRAPDGLLDDAEVAVFDALVWAGRTLGDDVSLAAALDASGAVDGMDLRLVDHLLRTEVTIEYGADADELSALWGLVEGGGGDDRLVVGGYVAAVDDLLTDVEVRLGWPVIAVGRDGTPTGPHGGALVTGADGETMAADRVVVTVPLGVLQAGTIRFDPPLPVGHQQAIEALAMGLLDKVWLQWDEPWWTETAQVWTRMAGVDAGFADWFNVAAVTDEPVLLALVGGRDARRWADATDDEVLEAALASLQPFRDAGW